MVCGLLFGVFCVCKSAGKYLLLHRVSMAKRVFSGILRLLGGDCS